MCNALNHPSWCTCGFGGDTGGGFRVAAPIPQRTLWRYRDDDFCRPTTCPECGAEVYFVRHNGGSVWFDELGSPWPKHGCFDDGGVGRVLRTSLLRPPRDSEAQPVFGIVTETVATRPGHGGRIVVRCSDGSTIDSEFNTQVNLTTFVGRVVMVHGKGTDKLQLVAVAARETPEPDVRVVTKAPGECSESELAAFERLVLMGGEVQKHGLVDRIRKANKLAFGYVSGVIAGVAGLKHPNANYRTSVFKKSGTELQSTAYSLELGWAYVSDAHRGRGLSGKLIRALLKRSEGLPVIATSRTDNAPMHRALERAQFTRTGSEFSSSRGKHQLQLFVRGAAQPFGAPDAPPAARG